MVVLVVVVVVVVVVEGTHWLARALVRWLLAVWHQRQWKHALRCVIA